MAVKDEVFGYRLRAGTSSQVSFSNDTYLGMPDLFQGEGVDRCIDAGFADQKIMIDYWHMILRQLNVYLC